MSTTPATTHSLAHNPLLRFCRSSAPSSPFPSSLHASRTVVGFRAATADREWVSSSQRFVSTTVLTALSLFVAEPAAHARLDALNNPQLLPSTPNEVVVDVSGALTKGEVARLTSASTRIENASGVKLRILSQRYPTSPGSAIAEYWRVDENTLVFVCDPELGNAVNFNVGKRVDERANASFFNRLASDFGSRKFIASKGEAEAIERSVAAIERCFVDETGC